MVVVVRTEILVVVLAAVVTPAELVVGIVVVMVLVEVADHTMAEQTKVMKVVYGMIMVKW